MNRSAANADAALLRKSEAARRTNEAIHDHTLQRQFELSFESRDLPGSLASKSDASDRGRFAAVAVRNLDADYRRRRREGLIRQAAAKVPRNRMWLRTLLWAIYRNGSDRQKTMTELGLPKRSYWWGLKYFSNIYLSK